MAGSQFADFPEVPGLPGASWAGPAWFRLWGPRREVRWGAGVPAELTAPHCGRGYVRVQLTLVRLHVHQGGPDAGCASRRSRVAAKSARARLRSGFAGEAAMLRHRKDR
jgi:hypothetical protein